MRGASVRAGWSHVAALLAVALLSLATIRSNVMQAGGIAGAAMPACGMAGMAHMRQADGGASRDRSAGKAHAACAFCAVAGHLPVCASAPALALPSPLAWVAWRPLAAAGARGPPGFAPRARGPPQDFHTI